MKIITTNSLINVGFRITFAGAPTVPNLKTRERNLFSARFRSSESFVPKSVEGLAIARLETKEGNFLFARFTFLS